MIKKMVIAEELMRTNYVTVDVSDTIGRMLGKLKLGRASHALVYRGKKYLGVVGKRFLLTSRIDAKRMKVGNLIKKRSKSKTPFYVPKLSKATELATIARLMASADVHILPVIEKNKVIGIVNIKDVAKAIADEYKGVSCDELSNPPITATPNDEIRKVLTTFNRQKIDHLPIVDDQGRLIGMVAASDLMENPEFWGHESQRIPKAAQHQGSKRSGYGTGEKTSMIQLPIKNCMSRRTPCCAPPKTSIPNAIQMMVSKDVNCLVLVRYEKPVGILTLKDILVDYSK